MASFKAAFCLEVPLLGIQLCKQKRFFLNCATLPAVHLTFLFLYMALIWGQSCVCQYSCTSQWLGILTWSKLEMTLMASMFCIWTASSFSFCRGRHTHRHRWAIIAIETNLYTCTTYKPHTIHKKGYCKLWLLGAYFLPGTRHHLVSACALNRVHDDGKKSSENHDIKNMTRWSSWSQRKKSYTRLQCFWLTQSHKPHPSWLTTGLLGLVKYDT